MTFKHNLLLTAIPCFKNIETIKMGSNVIVKRVDYQELLSPPKGIVIRAGVTPYTIIDDEEYYMLGITHEDFYTDIGGGCKSGKHKKETPIQCVIREINEEIDNRTGGIIKSILRHKRDDPNIVEIWRETGPTFKSLGYTFPMGNKQGPVHRYYIILYLNDPKLRLGGVTNKKEVLKYDWYPQKELPDLDINTSIVDFYKDAGILV